MALMKGKQLIDTAMKMAASRKMSKGGLAEPEIMKDPMDGATCASCGGKMMAYGGRVDEQEVSAIGKSGPYEEDENVRHNEPSFGGFSVDEDRDEEEDEDDTFPLKFSEGGGVDESFEAHSDQDADGDNDDLVFSPEVSENDFTEDKQDMDEDDKKNKFLKHFMIARRLRGGE